MAAATKEKKQPQQDSESKSCCKKGNDTEIKSTKVTYHFGISFQVDPNDPNSAWVKPDITFHEIETEDADRMEEQMKAALIGCENIHDKCMDFIQEKVQEIKDANS